MLIIFSVFIQYKVLLKQTFKIGLEIDLANFFDIFDYTRTYAGKIMTFTTNKGKYT